MLDKGLHNVRRKPIDKSKIGFFCCFCLPPLLLYILFCVYPIVSSLYTSFFECQGMTSCRQTTLSACKTT